MTAPFIYTLYNFNRRFKNYRNFEEIRALKLKIDSLSSIDAKIA